MGNKSAFLIVVLVVAIFAIDKFFIGANIDVFLAKKFSALVNQLAFWR